MASIGDFAYHANNHLHSADGVNIINAGKTW